MNEFLCHIFAVYSKLYLIDDQFVHYKVICNLVQRGIFNYGAVFFLRNPHVNVFIFPQSFFQRLRRWANNLNCFRSHGHDEEQENTSIY